MSMYYVRSVFVLFTLLWACESHAQQDIQSKNKNLQVTPPYLNSKPGRTYTAPEGGGTPGEQHGGSTTSGEVTGKAGEAAINILPKEVINFNGLLEGDISGPLTGTIIKKIGSLAASSVCAAAITTLSSTDLNTSNTLIKRDGVGNFSAGKITATLDGLASNVSGVINEIHGGTNQIGYAKGDILFASGGNKLSKLPISTHLGDILSVGTDGVPSWSSRPAGAEVFFSFKQSGLSSTSKSLRVDPDLQLMLGAHHSYEIELVLYVNTGTSDERHSDLDIALKGSEAIFVAYGVESTSGNFDGSATNINGTRIANIPVSLGGAKGMVIIKGLVRAGENPVNIQLQFAASTAGAPVVLGSGSTMKATQVR